MGQQGTIKGHRAMSAATAVSPYRFVPIDVAQAATDTPVWHDGAGSGELLSGELLCTLEALTPLLPGNHRYPVSEARALPGWPDLPAKKQIVEPLRLADGRVVIAGSALKGMLRHSLGALLSAPMERVGERHYSYRPNLDVRDDACPSLVTRPAVVADGEKGPLRVWVLDDARAAIFVRDEAIDILRRAATEESVIVKGRKIRGVVSDFTRTGNNRILARAEGSWVPDYDYVLVDYAGGIDGKGRLGAKFKPPTKTYSLALVPEDKLQDAVELTVGDTVLAAYRTTQKVLADGDRGHLFAHPLLDKNEIEDIAQGIRDHTDLRPWQLVYVEVRLDRGELTSKAEILSLGHHFRYRWAYTSSIRKKGGKTRSCLSPLADELGARPARLSGARLFFGYVRDDDNPLGKGVYRRLAGRIALNHALSDGVPGFLGTAEKSHCIPLPQLGQPKASAWEFYLQQSDDSNLPATYGDLPGDAGGELAGRKFYLHQPRVRTERDIADAAAVSDQNATLARFVCQPGSRFRFTLRFARLRLWELGALLAVLEPARLGKKDAVYAHKLGLGRPLGLGSVRIDIDRLRTRKESETHLTEPEERLIGQALDELRARLHTPTLERWLQIHRYIDRGRVAYPSAEIRGETTIFNWHTGIRREYSKLRREAGATGRHIKRKILPGQKLPETR